MSGQAEDYTAALEAASGHAREWLESLPDRPVRPQRSADELRTAFGESIPDGPSKPVDVVNLLADVAEPGLMAFGSGRFYGWVIGGVLPAALGADWLVSTWDQNTGLSAAAPAAAAIEETAGRWLLDVLGLPAGSGVGFVTGATMANFTGLAAGRQHVLAKAGWDVSTDGLTGAPKITVLVGRERHDSIDVALRYLGLGAPTIVGADAQGRIDVADLTAALESTDGPTIVCLQAGNVHSGAFDDFGPAIAAAHAHGAWVHVDGAFGLWAGTSPALRHLVAGYEAADSWATDAHKTLNVPYDCGVAIVADRNTMRATFGMTGEYLIRDDAGDPIEFVPEMSRRARGVPVWAALRCLGRTGVAELIDSMVANAKAIAAGVATIDGAEVLNQVDYTQVCVAFGSDEHTRAVVAALLADGTAWMSGSHWSGRDIMRISVSNWSTDDADVRASVDAVRRAAQAAG